MSIAALIIAASVLFAAVLTFSITLVLRSSAAYRVGVERASRSREVIALIGGPVEPGRFVRGGVRGGGRLAALQTQLSGPRGKGRLEIRAVNSEGELRFEVLRFHSGERVVDLLSPSHT